MKAFRINESEVYAGHTLEEDIESAMQDSGLSREEVFDDIYGVEMPRDYSLFMADTDQFTTIGELIDEMSSPGLVVAFDI
jgi:hypothetical protein